MSTKTHLVHLSDMHFDASERNTLPFKFIQDSLVTHLNSLDGTKILVLGGDITFQGSARGYELAERFFEFIITRTHLDRANIIVCPGNHDIMKDRQFEGLDGFTYALRQDRMFEYRRKHCFFYRIGIFEFIINNSAFHENYQYGFVDIDSISECITSLETRTDSKIRVLVTHHHLFPLFEHDTSATRNAYGLMTLVDKHGFHLILHGHQHFNMGFPIGHTPAHCFGVGSFNFVSGGILNGINHFEVGAGMIEMTRHTLILDGPARHKSGFVKIGDSYRIPTL
jgi:3',5'-cyclic AMP phosphodiesterase CpdA